MKLKRVCGMFVVNRIPDGWHRVCAPNIPKEYVLLCNRESRFSGKRRVALMDMEKYYEEMEGHN